MVDRRSRYQTEMAVTELWHDRFPDRETTRKHVPTRRPGREHLWWTTTVRRRILLPILIIGLFAASCGGTDDAESAASANDDDETVQAVEPAAASDGVDEADNTAAADEPESDSAVTAAEPTPTPAGPRVAAQVDLASVPSGELRDFGPAPTVPTGPLAPEVLEAVDTLMGERLLRRVIDELSFEAIATLGQSDDPRVSWWLADLMRVGTNAELARLLTDAQQELLGIEIDPARGWGFTTDRLIAWDIPAPPDYLTYKRNAYVVVEPRWEPLFEDGTDIDWRLVSWGGVFIDARPFGTTDNPCNCIPAADDPMTTDAAGGDEWLDDDTIVFGVSINGEHRAYPRSIMEVREMVNDTLGERDFAMPYCTLCGSAQVFFTDDLPDGIERPVLRTSGLLSRSNKVMYDVNTFSIFDTFLGKAVSGPLAEAGIELDQNSVITTTWGRWKADHPDTTVLDISLALGRPDSDLRNTRDAGGPIFPIGEVDPRLPVQEDVLGVVDANGDAIAFHVASARAALERGEFIEVNGISVVLDGGGVRAVDADGNDLGGHQAFWFAWSQFYPGTELWPS